jgi:hypothetical protein
METPNLKKKLEDYKNKIKFDFNGNSFSNSIDNILKNKKIYPLIFIFIFVFTSIINPVFLRTKIDNKEKTTKYSIKNVFLFSILIFILFCLSIFVYNYKKTN